MAWSKTQINKLGERLRKAETPVSEDRDALQEVLALYDEARLILENELTLLGYHPTSRLKSTETILEKMHRDKTSLARMQDIAGARIVLDDAGLDDQDDTVAQVLTRWPEASANVYDRRTNPSHGYRAVHVIVNVEERPCEIQVRTALQHQWAELNEKAGDLFGRGIRYGEPADEVDRVLVADADPPITVEDVLALIQAMGDDAANIETLEQRLAQVKLTKAFEDPADEHESAEAAIRDQEIIDLEADIDRIKTKTLDQMKGLTGALGSS